MVTDGTVGNHYPLSFLLLNLVTITSDPKDIHMYSLDVTLRCIKSHLYHVVYLSTCNDVFIFFAFDNEQNLKP